MATKPEIITAIDANTLLGVTVMKMNGLPYTYLVDLRRLKYNILDMIDELSRLEVYTRRTGPRSRWAIARNKKQAEILSAIDYLDKMIVLAVLLV